MSYKCLPLSDPLNMSYVFLMMRAEPWSVCMCCCPGGQDCSGFFIGGGSPCRSTPKHSHRGKSHSSHLLLQWEGPRPELSQPSIPLLPTSPALLCSCKSGFAHRARAVLVVLTRQAAPGGWMVLVSRPSWPPGRGANCA